MEADPFSAVIDSPALRLRAWSLACSGGASNVLRVGALSWSWDMRPRVQKNGAVIGRCYSQARGEFPRDAGSYKIAANGRVLELPEALRAVLPGGMEERSAEPAEPLAPELALAIEEAARGR